MIDGAIKGAIFAGLSVLFIYLGRYKGFRVLIRVILVMIVVAMVIAAIWLGLNADNL